ncbi:odorant receptor Or1-like [Pectinophora gossypiella]|uniref:odorant receptor Or1-like n=1 Tax=Pectinophora gossypiella TaxID=13191 RepID=UPI00214EB67B|nr:odorant receptor Or1-like [Pectinophora gossypiella]
MTVLIRNVNTSISMSLTVLKLVGFWAPEGMAERKKIMYYCYSCFSFMFLLGTYLIIQIVDLFMIWGNLPLMTGTAFVLFTNLAQTVKIVNILAKREKIQKIIYDADDVLRKEDTEEGIKIVKRCNRETMILQVLYLSLTLITTTGWATSAEKGQLPLRAWYPYNTSKSPAFELTYLHQVGAINIAACLNVGKDTLVSALIAQCRCRLQLLGLSLKTLCKDMKMSKKLVYTQDQEAVAAERLRKCVAQHQAALQTAVDLQACFSIPTFLQFFISLIIICVTAFQLVSQTGNLVRLMSMGTYLLNMMFQVFIYCYQGHHLSEESADVAVSAYECPWYACSVRLRRDILVIMTRTRRLARITAGGFTTLSLASFMSIIKASYSLFTLLQQVNEEN